MKIVYKEEGAWVGNEFGKWAGNYLNILNGIIKELKKSQHYFHLAYLCQNLPK